MLVFALALAANLTAVPAQIVSPFAPQILDIKFPNGRNADDEADPLCAGTNWIPGDGTTRCKGTIAFKDKDGDLNRVLFKVVQASASNDITDSDFDPQVKPGTTAGSFEFVGSTKVVQRVTIEVLLEDEKKNKSEPKRFSFLAVGPEPVITAVEFSEKICPFPTSLTAPCADEAIGAIAFVDRQADIASVDLIPEQFKDELTVKRLADNVIVCKISSEAPAPCTFDPRIEGQREGKIRLSILLKTPQRVTLGVILKDRSRQRSQIDRLSCCERFQFVFAKEVTTDLFFITQWGSLGNARGQFNEPQGLTVDSSGNVYVADTRNNRFQRFDGEGKAALVWGSLCNLRTGENCVDPDGGGPLVSGDGQFFLPLDIAVDASGNVYVADTSNHRIQKFVAASLDLTAGTVRLESARFRKWGSLCHLTQQPELCVDPDGSGPQERGDGQFRFPKGIAVDRSGNVYVVDSGNNRVQKFDANGSFLLKWGSKCEIPRLADLDKGGCKDPDGNGPLEIGDGQFNDPQGIVIDGSANVYVADTSNNRVQKFDPNGKFLQKFVACIRTSDGNQFSFFLPQGLTVDAGNNLYITEVGNSIDRVQKCDGSASALLLWGKSGFDAGEFQVPSDVAIDARGGIFVLDRDNHRVQKFGRL